MSTATAIPRRLTGATIFYRVMAYITGTLLIVLTVATVWKYTQGGDVADTLTSIVGFVHGWLFVIYCISILNLGLRARMSWARMIIVAICGFIPVFTFVAERSTVHAIAQPVH